MAKVKPEMPPSGYQEEYVLCSGVRSGLKREFAFALKAQTDILMSSTGRTRSGKIQHSAVSSRQARAKRRKKLDSGISPSDKIRILPGSEDVEPLGTETAVESAMPVGADTEEKAVAASNGDASVVPNDSINEAGDFMPIESISVQNDTGAMTDNVASIQVGEISVNKASQADHPVEEFTPKNTASNLEGSSPELPQRNQAEEGASPENNPSIQLLSRPVQKLAQYNEVDEGSSTRKIPPILVYSRSVTKIAKRKYVIDGPSMKRDPSILVYERSITKMLRKGHLKGEASSVKAFPNLEEGPSAERISSVQVGESPLLENSHRNRAGAANHVEERPSAECISSIQINESPLMETSERNQAEEAVSTENLTLNKVESCSVVNVSRENHFQDEASVEKITPINHPEEVAVAEDISTRQVDETLLLGVPVMNHGDEEESADNISLVLVDRGAVESVSIENNLLDQIDTGLMATVSLMNHVEEGASMEDLSSMEIDVNPPLENCFKETASTDVSPLADSQYDCQGNHVVIEASVENISSTQEALIPVLEVTHLNKDEERASLDIISSVEVHTSRETERGVYQKVEKIILSEEPMRRFTRSLLKAEEKEHSGIQSLQEYKISVANNSHRSNVEKMASLENTSSVQVVASNVANISRMDYAAKSVVTEMTVEIEKGVYQKIEKNIISEEPMRRFTRSLLKADEKEQSGVQSPLEDTISECSLGNTSSVQVDANHEVNIERNVVIEKGVYQKIEQNVLTEDPMRRFTRSLLKVEEKEQSLPVVEESLSIIADVSLAVSGASDGCEVIKDLPDTVNVSEEPLQVAPKRKMELKMSKKITLSKLPSTIRDLLATGLLEGLPVKYLSHSYDKQGGLRGVIKGGGILCFCDSCKGVNIVTAYNFEIHAGSRKKHPSDFICLENGNSIHDVLRACSSAPLDMLESTIQNAISSEGGKILKNEKYRDFWTKSLPRRSASPTSPNPCQEAVSTSRPSRSIFSTKSSESMQKYLSSQKGSRGRMTTKDLRLHKLVFMDDILPEGTEVAYYSRGQRLLDGYIKNSGIFCHCCSTVVSPSLFEAHAGCASRRKPYLNIYTSNGVSLHELSVSLSKGKKFSTSESDDLCRICGDGGDLLLCDICPRAYHKECVGVTNIPTGDWYCPCCQNMHLKDKSGETNENAIAAGRVAGVDPIEEIFKRCIRIAKTPEANFGGCVLCRLHDFSRSDFGPRTVLLCDQCEREFHVGCLKEHNLADLMELPEGKWFCSPDCDRIHVTLEKLLSSGEENLPLCPINVIKKKKDDLVLGEDENLDIRWKILSGKSASPETRSFLSKALNIFYESFDPIVDFATKKDLIPAMVYGWDLRDQDFGGMFCAVLTVNSSVVSAAILRVLGCEVAELPLVATSRENQGKGYFQSLFLCIEAFLDSLKVKHLVLPAAEEAEAIWTKKFGFTKISFDQLNEYMKGIRTMIFEGTSLLHKEISRPLKLEEQAS